MLGSKRWPRRFDYNIRITFERCRLTKLASLFALLFKNACLHWKIFLQCANFCADSYLHWRIVVNTFANYYLCLMILGNDVHKCRNSDLHWMNLWKCVTLVHIHICTVVFSWQFCSCFCKFIFALQYFLGNFVHASANSYHWHCWIFLAILFMILQIHMCPLGFSLQIVHACANSYWHCWIFVSTSSAFGSWNKCK